MKPSAAGRIPDRGELAGGAIWFSRRGFELTLGLTDAGLEALGDIQSVEVWEEGSPFSQGDLLIEVEGAESNLELEAPGPGSVLEANAGALRDPAIIEDDPLEAGWLIRVEIPELDRRWLP